MTTSRDAYIVLNRIEGIGPVRVKALCEALGSPEAVLGAPADVLSRVRGIGPKIAESLAEQAGRLDAASEEEKAARLGAKLVTPLDGGYPEPLRNIYDPPLCLYVAGEWRASDARALAVVGTRRMSKYGEAQTERLAAGIAKAGFTVVSGLARGVDTVAHRAALSAGGRTVAVLGGALDKLYPPENRDLARAIAAGRGAVMSEYPMGRSPDRTTFPCRNRIVAGLSRGVVVTEAPVDSGAMNTASQALEQGRSVLAVPGRVDMEGARGPNKLIREGAVLVQEVADVLEEFEGLFPASAIARENQRQDIRQRLPLSPEEERVVRALWREPEMDLDELARRAELPVQRLLTLSLQMEMKRILRRLPGRRVALADGVRGWTFPGGEAP